MKLIECTCVRVDVAGVLEDSRSLLDRLAEEDGTSERGPLLALLELERTVAESHPSARTSPFLPHSYLTFLIASSTTHTYISLLQRYFTTFGDKASCYEDLKLASFFSDEKDGGETRKAWREFLDSRDLSNAAKDKKELIKQINIFKLRRWDLQPEEIDVEGEQERAKAYVRAYLDALPLGRIVAAKSNMSSVLK
jgi:N-terminal acetyltransferase B complex non-catalytic subunit